jgi:hypothetical protein
MDTFDLAVPQPHPCEKAGCDREVQFDDEPYCFEHADDRGAYQRGYSYRRQHAPQN